MRAFLVGYVIVRVRQGNEVQGALLSLSKFVRQVVDTMLNSGLIRVADISDV